MSDLIAVNEFDGDDVGMNNNGIPIVREKESICVSKSTNQLEQDLLSKVDELVSQQETEDQINDQTTKRILSQTIVATEELFGDLKNEDIDLIYVKPPSTKQPPPVPASLKDIKPKGVPKQLPPLPSTVVSKAFKAPPPIPTYLRKTKFDIEYNIYGDEQCAVTIFLKGPNTKCLAPTTTQILAMSCGIEMNILEQPSLEKNDDPTINQLQYVTYGSYSMRQFINPILTDLPLEVTFFSPLKGKIVQIEIHNAPILVKNEALICAVPRPSETAFENVIAISNVTSENDNISLDRITGLGYIFLCCNGSIIHKMLQMGQEMLVKSSAILALENTATYGKIDETVADHEFADKLRLDFKVSGPGVIYLQTHP